MMSCLSVVIPAYNEEAMLDRTVSVLASVLEGEGISYELIFVDDGSRDKTWERIEQAASQNTNVHGIRFSRNFGKESAIFAGLASAEGECVAVMDCDLQHPPAVLVEMFRLWEQGYEVVEAVKRSRGDETLLHRFSAGMFYHLMSKATKLDMSRASDFKLLDRKAVNALLSLPEKNAFFRALSSWIGFHTTSVEFDVQEREAGESKWSTKALIMYAISNITGFSAFPMQFVTGAGIAVFCFAVILSIHTLFRYCTGSAVEGFTTVILLILLIGSIIMISLGIIGYYLAKIYQEVQDRPRYLISRQI